jgi:hypothetical protein
LLRKKWVGWSQLVHEICERVVILF